MITKDPERRETLESEFEGENEGKDVDTSDTDNVGESHNDSRSSDAGGQANNSMNGILGGLLITHCLTVSLKYFQEIFKKC